MDKTGFIKYLESKDLTLRTITEYVRLAEQFFENTKKEDLQITKPDVLKYLEVLKNSGLQNNTRQIRLNVLNHYFTFLYKEGKIAKNPCLLLKIRGLYKKRLYKIYTPEELEKLFDAYYQAFVRSSDNRYKYELQKQYSVLSMERNILILSILINQGVATNEIDKLETGDIDFTKATIKIKGGKKLNDRVLPLKAAQIGLIMQYLQNIRPQLLEYQKIETNKLFILSLSVRKKKDDGLMNIFMSFTKQMKSIDKQFFNFQQIRTSLISFWIKNYGLRQAQYFAGHRYISTTEKYVTNNLDGLIDDINKLNPFDF